MRGAVQAQATYLRRQQTLADLNQRLAGKSSVGEGDRTAVLDGLTTDQAERAEDLLVRRSGDPTL